MNAKSCRSPVLALFLFSSACLPLSMATAEPMLYAIEWRCDASPSLFRLNYDLSVDREIAITVDGRSIVGQETSLAVDPVTNSVYTLVRYANEDPFIQSFEQNLIVVDPISGEGVHVGPMLDVTGRPYPDAVDDLAFDSNGNLYAIEGRGSCGEVNALPDLREVNLQDGTTSFLTRVHFEAPYQGALAFNPLNGLMYYLRGSENPLFVSIDLSDGTVTPIELPGNFSLPNFINGMTFDPVQHAFLVTAGNYLDRRVESAERSEWYSLTPEGGTAYLGTTDRAWQGLAFFEMSTVDTDGDGIQDDVDNCPLVANADQADTDNDTVGDACDAFPDDPNEWADSDGDGVGDNSDAFPDDPSEWADTDGDGVGDNSDVFPNDPNEWSDTDGDGVGDNADAFPNDPTEWEDSDGDGVGNNSDQDDDNDGIPDVDDPYPTGRYADVSPTHWAFRFVESIANTGVVDDCGVDEYCPSDSLSRAEIAVILERAMNGSAYSPPAATGAVFNDVDAGDFAAAFIEQLAADGITAGCGNGNYCPGAVVTRDQMAVFLLRAKHGSGHSPPSPNGIFADVPTEHWAAAWIEQLAAEGITAGCGVGKYCPENPVTRDQLAVFLVRTFDL